VTVRRLPRALAVLPALVAAMVAGAGSAHAATSLPDGRVYEQVTPVDKGGAQIIGTLNNDAAVSPDGNSLLWETSASSLPASTLGPPVPSNESLSYVFVRGSSGWSPRPAVPPDTLVVNHVSDPDVLDAVSADLTTSLSTSLATLTPSTVQVVSGTFPIDNLVSYNGATTTLLTPPVPTSPADQTGLYQRPTYVGESASGDHAVFVANATFRVQNGTVPDGTSTAPNPFLYDYSGGGLWQVGLETDNATPFPGGEQGLIGPGVVSDDGSHVFFGASTNVPAAGDPISPPTTIANQLFVRNNDTGAGATTVPVSISTRSSDDSSCELATNPGAADTAPATFAGATPDGSIAFFLSNCELTNSSNTGASDANQDLYMYNVGTGALTDLDPGANVQGVVGFSSDGSYVYFVAGTSLYLYHAGNVTSLGALAPADSRAWTPTQAVQTPLDTTVIPVGPSYQSMAASVTADGQHLLIASAANLTSYQSGGTTELYYYSASGGTWTCVSCNPSGAAPTNPATMAVNSLSQDGSEVFFTTPDQLVSGDTNAVNDVYEWDANAQPASSTTAEDPYGGGSVSLLSSGSPPAPGASTLPPAVSGSSLIAASPTGSDVFFITRDQLVAQDQDAETDVYDARVDGTSPPTPPTTGTPCAVPLDGSCQGSPSPAPSFAQPMINAAGTNVTTTVTRTSSSSTTTALKLTLTMPTAAKLRAAARSGRLPVTVRVSGKATVVADASAVIGGRRVRVARSSGVSHGSGSLTLTLALSKAARRALTAHGRLSLLVRVSASGAATRDLTIVLKR
jgi:hypothetical protein